MISIVRNVEFGQWKNCVAFVQIGSVAVVFGRGGSGYGLELFTRARWFALRPFKSLTLRRS